jgi:hypothetical protein
LSLGPVSMASWEALATGTLPPVMLSSRAIHQNAKRFEIPICSSYVWCFKFFNFNVTSTTVSLQSTHQNIENGCLFFQENFC